LAGSDKHANLGEKPGPTTVASQAKKMKIAGNSTGKAPPASKSPQQSSAINVTTIQRRKDICRSNCKFASLNASISDPAASDSITLWKEA
jgi:hypothetical protein